MKRLFFLLIISISIQASIGINNLSPVGITEHETKALTSRVQIELTRAGLNVIERSDLGDILQEQALQQSGVTDYQDQSGAIQTVDSLVSGYAGITEKGYFLLLKMVEVKTGKVLAVDEIEVLGSLESLMGAAGVCVRRLLNKEQASGTKTIKVPDKPIGVISEKVVHEHHVFEHKSGTHNKATFVPCPLCGGRGKLPDGSDCNRCNISSMYKGPETGWTWMTGRWIR